MDEKQALKALKQRDEAALSWFIERYAPYVTTIVFHILGGSMSGCDIEETASDVFLALWKNAGKIRTGKVKAWLSAAARNKARDRLRRAGCDLPLEEDVLAVSGEDVERDLVMREQARLVKRAMLHMEPTDREIFLRRFYYYQPLNQIAEEMELNLNTVKTRLRRGREKLKEELRKGGYDVEDMYF